MLKVGTALPADEPSPAWASADDLRPVRAAPCDAALCFPPTLPRICWLAASAAPRPLLSAPLTPPLPLKDRSLLMICLFLTPAARPFGTAGLVALSFNTCEAACATLFAPDPLFATLKRAARAVSAFPSLLTGPRGMLFIRRSSTIRGLGVWRLGN